MALNVCPQGKDTSRAEVLHLRVRAQEEVTLTQLERTMKRLITAALLTLAVTGAYANDKAAGQCAALLFVKDASAGAQQAINAASNKPLAQNHATTWIRQLAANKSNRSIVDSMTWEAVSSCRKIGMRASDYIR
jgi:hypothetical protein